jgi:hypothetical protein
MKILVHEIALMCAQSFIYGQTIHVLTNVCQGKKSVQMDAMTHALQTYHGFVTIHIVIQLVQSIMMWKTCVALTVARLDQL